MNHSLSPSKVLRHASIILRSQVAASSSLIRTFAMSTSAPSTPPAQTSPYKPRYIDIGINLTDPIYTGIYNGKQRHSSDLHSVIARAIKVGCEKLIVTGSNLEESEKAVELAGEFPGTVYATTGIHPCSTSHPSVPSSLPLLKSLALSAKETGKAIAFGEIGLDYDRLTHSPRETQLLYFAKQLDIAVEVALPLFLHSRAAHTDFMRLLNEREEGLPRRGVVHSFTGSLEEMQELVGHGWYIGVNGCSLKTEDNLAVVKEIPLDKIMLETDGPWCEIRPSHASAKLLKGWEERHKWVKKEKWEEGACVKGRNESCTIGKVAWVIAGVKGISVEEVCEAAWENTVRVFGIGDKE